MKKNQNKKIGIIAFCLLAFVGTYNAVMINSESTIHDLSQFKRLDETLGVVKVGRTLAVSTDWRNLSKPAPAAVVAQASAAPAISSAVSAPVDHEASIKDSLNLKLVEVINAKKWSQGVQPSEFSGSISTNEGIIESLVASLPGSHNIEISFSEMNGNVFEYDLGGEVYSGMMYQVDQNAYMVSLTNGPLEGTRLRFAGEKNETENYLAETHHIEVQNFGEESEVSEPEVTETVATKEETPSYNFNI